LAASIVGKDNATGTLFVGGTLATLALMIVLALQASRRL